jgi:hypothetical protein
MKTKYILIILGVIAAIEGILIYLDLTAWNNAISTAATNTALPGNTSTEPTPPSGPDLEPAGELVLPQYITPVPVEDAPILIQQPVKNPGGSPAINTDLEATFYPPAD